MSSLYLKSIYVKDEIPEEAYYRAIPLVSHLVGNPLVLRTPVTFLVGENGAGKSTLLEAIATNLGFNAEGGSRNLKFSTVDTHSGLHRYLVCARNGYPRDGFFLRAESFYNVASEIDRLQQEDGRMLLSYGGVSLHEQSHGESYLSLMKNRFGSDSIFLLDEPEAALSVNGLMKLLCIIHDLEGKNCQFLISTHSPVLMAYPGATIFQAGEDGLYEVTYTETDHYRLTREFILNPDKMFHYLFHDDTQE